MVCEKHSSTCGMQKHSLIISKAKENRPRGKLSACALHQRILRASEQANVTNMKMQTWQTHSCIKTQSHYSCVDVGDVKLHKKSRADEQTDPELWIRTETDHVCVQFLAKIVVI